MGGGSPPGSLEAVPMADGDWMVSMVWFWSEGVMAVPEGRHRPRLKRSSATFPPITRHLYWGLPVLGFWDSMDGIWVFKTGCMCMGFQTGRDSMFSASKAKRTDSRSAPNCSGVISITVSHRFDLQYAASGMNSIPGRSERAC